MTIQAGEARAGNAASRTPSPHSDSDSADSDATAGPADPDVTPETDGTVEADAAAAQLSATRGGEKQGLAERLALSLFILVPFAALVAAVPVAWGWGLGWT